MLKIARHHAFTGGASFESTFVHQELAYTALGKSSAMECRTHIAFLAFVVLGLLRGNCTGGGAFRPELDQESARAKSVAIEIVADWNRVERYRRDNIRTDITDFNGYWGGNLMLIVPAAWSVEITFINGSLSFPHSLMVTRVYAQSEMPVKLMAKDAIWGAHTDPPEGIKYNERRQLNFVALQAGKYFLACARQTHLMDGHWFRGEKQPRPSRSSRP